MVVKRWKSRQALCGVADVVPMFEGGNAMFRSGRGGEAEG